VQHGFSGGNRTIYRDACLQSLGTAGISAASHVDTHMAADSPTLPNPNGKASAHPVEWAVARGLVPYEAASTFMVERSDAIAAGTASEMVWLLEHPPVYTAGTSARPDDLLQPGRFPVHATGRGGQFTYHGPGQRVVYVMLDVKRRFGDVRAYVHALETWASWVWRRAPSTAGSAFGCGGRRAARRGTTRSPRSGCGCGAG
jgi:hypothetical protein